MLRCKQMSFLENQFSRMSLGFKLVYGFLRHYIVGKDGAKGGRFETLFFHRGIIVFLRKINIIIKLGFAQNLISNFNKHVASMRHILLAT